MKRRYVMRARVWLYPGMEGWHFVTVPKKHSCEIKRTFEDVHRGWGSLPVAVTVGATRWATSIFPDKKSDVYFLPLKAEVRKREQIAAGDVITLALEIRV